MDIYKKMYCHLFNSITDILETDVDDFTREKLKQAQIDTEEMFISFDQSSNIYCTTHHPD